MLREAKFYELHDVVLALEAKLEPPEPKPWWRLLRDFVVDHYLKALGALVARAIFKQIKKRLNKTIQ